MCSRSSSATAATPTASAGTSLRPQLKADGMTRGGGTTQNNGDTAISIMHTVKTPPPAEGVTGPHEIFSGSGKWRFWGDDQGAQPCGITHLFQQTQGLERRLPAQLNSRPRKGGRSARVHQRFVDR